MPATAKIEYKDLFEALPQSYIMFGADDPKFTITAENRAHADVALVKPGEAVGKPLFEVFPDSSPKYKQTGVSDLLESIRKVIRTGKPDSMDTFRYDLPRPDGSMERRYWRVTHYPIFNGSKKVEHVLQATENVTQETLADRKLDEAQRQLDQALAIGMIGTWLWDLKEDYVVADQNLLRLFGVEPEEAVDGLPIKDFTDAIHPDDRPLVTKLIEEAVAKKGSFEQEYRTISRSGEVRWVMARGRVEADEDGEVLRFPGVVIDITDRKSNEQNLRYMAQVSTALSSSLDYNKTLESIARLAIPELADWCTIDLLEDGELRLVGLAHKDPKKIEWARNLRQRQPVRLDDKTGVAAVLRTGKPEYYPLITEDMLRAMAHDEEELRLVLGLKLTSAMTVPLKAGNSTIGALTLISSELKRRYTPEDLRTAEEVANRAALAIVNADLYRTAQEEIEARAMLEEKLREANDQLEARVRKRTAQLEETNRNLERSNQELQDFAYVASHDLQEPLRKIQAFGNLLEEEFGPNLGEGRDYLERMRNAASRMSILIEDLLSFSRVTTKANPPTEVNLNQVAREVLEDLEVRIKESGATVTVSKLPVVMADRLQIRQLLQNLIGNALKFAQPGAAPRVRVYAQNGKTEGRGSAYCQLMVEDNGIGFDEKYLDRIFAVFQRLHGKESYQGTGIGLAICRKIVERHGGSITAKSTPGKGSIFIATLPAKPSP